ncbi:MULTISPECIES: hypothetical protein [Clostridiaceae]|uniref:DUF4190 domain-containing protein n=1 Tax=Clostridium facile TaxID=2763035 RepID=A0ABR7IR76_9CLOT|nr:MULTISPECIES: hypothetical protein [Clostridiaceae]MBC5787654.1 hypothetical protein [Clostridium facile]
MQNGFSQPPYPNPNMPPYYPPQPPRKSSGKSIASLVLGIISDALLVITCCVFPWISLICSIIGIILGMLGKKENSNGVAIAGLITNIIALVLSIAMVFLVILVYIGILDTSGWYYNYSFYSPFIQ